MNTRSSTKTNSEGERGDCMRAWERLDQADARLRTAGGQEMEAALDAFHEAWAERLAALATGDTGVETMKRVRASVRRMEQAAATPQALLAMAAFMSIAVLEVETAVVRSTGNELPQPSLGVAMDLERVPARGSC